MKSESIFSKERVLIEGMGGFYEIVYTSVKVDDNQIGIYYIFMIIPKWDWIFDDAFLYKSEIILFHEFLLFVLLNHSKVSLYWFILGIVDQKICFFCKHLSAIDQNNSMIFTTMMLKEKNARLKNKIKIPPNNWSSWELKRYIVRQKLKFCKSKERKK